MPKNIENAGLAVLSSAIALVTPLTANAAVFDFRFEDTFGMSGGVVEGFVEFNDADVFPNATGVAATDVRVTEVLNFDGVNPIFNDGGLELNLNLVENGEVESNEFAFGSSEEIVFFDFLSLLFDSNDNAEGLSLSDSIALISEFNVTTDDFFSLANRGSNPVSFSPREVDPEPTSVPEPATGIALMLLGLMALNNCAGKFRLPIK